MRLNKYKFDLSVLFADSKGSQRFLFRVLNIGKGHIDDLKFVIIPPVKNLRFDYREYPECFSTQDILGQYGEISYHSDGSMLFKLNPMDEDQQRHVYRNPKGRGNRRTPISEIKDWEPILRITIRDYEKCRKVVAEKEAIFPWRSSIFNGEPFECDLFLGHETNPTPLNNQIDNELLLRIPGVAFNVDLICWVSKISSLGRRIHLGSSSDKALYFRLNEIQALEGRKDFSLVGV